MSNLDAIVATVEDAIVPGLGYSLHTQKASSYVREYKFSTFRPSGSNIYSVASGQRVIRFLISDGGKAMLDLHTLRLNFQITNTDAANPLYLTGRHPACLFSRLTIRIAERRWRISSTTTASSGCFRISARRTPWLQRAPWASAPPPTT